MNPSRYPMIRLQGVWMFIARVRFATPAALCILVIQGCSGTGGDQPRHEPPRIALSRGERIEGQCFGAVAIRELSDRSLLVADQFEGLLHVIPGTGMVQHLGREGSGPGEYRAVSGLFSLRGDSTALYDGANGRLIFLEGSRMLDAVEKVDGSLGGVDTLGHFLTASLFSPPPTAGRRGSETLIDSVVLIQERRGLQEKDTLARLAVRTGASASIDGVRYLLYNHLSRTEPALLLPDGWIAVARPEPYVVDWRMPSGQWVRGSPIPFDPIRVNQDEVLASYIRYFNGGAGIPEDEWRPQKDVERYGLYLEWPTTLPAFQPLAPNASGQSLFFGSRILFATPDGDLLVRRATPANFKAVRYDLIDRSGALRSYLTLDPGEEIIGSGHGSVYTIRTDSVGCQELFRIPWPRNAASGAARREDAAGS